MTIYFNSLDHSVNYWLHPVLVDNNVNHNSKTSVRNHRNRRLPFLLDGHHNPWRIDIFVIIGNGILSTFVYSKPHDGSSMEEKSNEVHLGWRTWNLHPLDLGYVWSYFVFW